MQNEKAYADKKLKKYAEKRKRETVKSKKSIDRLKHYLKSAWYWKNKRDYYSEKILRLRSQAEKITTTFSDVPTFGSFADHRQAVIAEMVDTQKKYETAVQECKKKLAEIRLLINSLEDYQESLVLEMRYLCFENWQDIALKLNYEERQIYRIHGRALLHLLESHKKIIENGGKPLF